MTPEERAEILSDAEWPTISQSSIAAAIREAVLEERERCAGIATRTITTPRPAGPELGPRLPGYAAGYADGNSDTVSAIVADIMGYADDLPSREGTP